MHFTESVALSNRSLQLACNFSTEYVNLLHIITLYKFQFKPVVLS